VLRIRCVRPALVVEVRRIQIRLNLVLDYSEHDLPVFLNPIVICESKIT